MDSATIQAKIWTGYGMAAMRVGTPYTQYRAASALAPMATVLSTQNAVFDVGNYVFGAPQNYGIAIWRALINGNFTQPWDILEGAAGTFFIASQDPLLPILAVRCNSIVTVYRPGAPAAFGVLPYGGDTEASRVPIMTGWPASILAGTHTPEGGPVGLPGDSKKPWKEILLPAFSGVEILTNDYITDSNGLRYQASDVELTNLGWRIAAEVRES